MVKFIIPFDEAAAAANNQPRVTRDLLKSEYSPFSIEMVLVGFKALGYGLGQFWRDSLFGISKLPSYYDAELAANNLRDKLQNGTYRDKYNRFRDGYKNQMSALAAKDVGDAESPDEYEDYEQMDDYNWETLRYWDSTIPKEQVLFPVYFTKHYQIMKENQAKRNDFKKYEYIPWDHWPAKPDPYRPACQTTEGQVEEALAEALPIEHIRHLSTRMGLVPGSSGDGQDPDDNRGPPRKKLPDDKIGGSDDEEAKKKKRKKNKSTNSRLVRVTSVAVRNTNQVSTFNFFLLLSTTT